MDFQIEKHFGSHKLKYINLTEITQGGPEVGNIIIDNKDIRPLFFGGPAINFNNFLYLPLFDKSFFNRGFKIGQIDLETLEVTAFGKNKNFIFLDKIENDVIYYFEDLNKTKKSCYILPK
jgi:hypothetical protein